MIKKWTRIADQEYAAMDNEEQLDWKDLRKIVQKRH